MAPGNKYTREENQIEITKSHGGNDGDYSMV